MRSLEPSRERVTSQSAKHSVHSKRYINIVNMSNENSSSNTSVTSSECDSSDISFDEDFSLCNDLSKLTPYSFEPLASSSSSEDEHENVPEFYSKMTTSS